MSIFLSGQRGFFLNQYGQSGISMDWFQLTDPFTQQLPLKITNTLSGTLWFQGAIVPPRSGYYNFSGIAMGSVAAGGNATLVMTWDVGVSGWIVSSSPITDTLNLQLIAFLSGTSPYTSPYSSGVLSGLPNTLYNRYSGVIKVFGDIYNNDQPTPTLTQGNAVGFAASQVMSYGISYILSGWESDIGAPSNITIISGAVGVSWSSVVGVTQYMVYRWSGSTDFSVPASTFAGSMDLVFTSSTTSFTDANILPIKSGYFRHRSWENGLTTLAGANASIYLSPPQSRGMSGGAVGLPQIFGHAYHLNKNLSGTSLLGPFYVVFHTRQRDQVSGLGLAIVNGLDVVTTSGTVIADIPVLSNQVINVWYRYSVLLGQSGTLSASGYSTMQFQELINAGVFNIDDVFVIALS